MNACHVVTRPVVELLETVMERRSRRHTALVVQPVVLLRGQSYLHRTIRRCDCSGVIPLHVVGRPVVEIYSFPVWIVAGVKGATILIELDYRMSILSTV